MILRRQLDRALISLFFLEIRRQKCHMILFPHRLPDRIEAPGIFERTDREGRREPVIAALGCQLRRFPEAHLKTNTAAIAALRILLMPPDCLIVAFRVVFSFYKPDRMHRWKLPDQPLYLLRARLIFLFR